MCVCALCKWFRFLHTLLLRIEMLQICSREQIWPRKTFGFQCIEFWSNITHWFISHLMHWIGRRKISCTCSNWKNSKNPLNIHLAWMLQECSNWIFEIRCGRLASELMAQSYSEYVLSWMDSLNSVWCKP